MFAEPAESNMSLLDQMTLEDQDQEALDHFLNSADGEDAAGWAEPGQSPPTLPGSSHGQKEQLLRPDGDGDGEEGSSEESDPPLVQVDEEDVQLDLSLVGRGGRPAVCVWSCKLTDPLIYET